MTSPTVGRVVHYRSYGTPGGEYVPACRAAIVTECNEHDDIVGLAVLNPQGLFFDRGNQHDETKASGGTWHWPCIISTDVETVMGVLKEQNGETTVDGSTVLPTEEVLEALRDKPTSSLR